MDDAELLAGVPLLAGLPPASLARTAAATAITRVLAGHVLLRQGERSDSLYVVRSGRVEVLVDDAVVRTVGAGEVFGELALLGSGTRTATVRALRDSELLTLSGAVFQQLLADEPSIALALLRELSRRVIRGAEPPAGRRTGAVLAVMAMHQDNPDVLDLVKRLAADLPAEVLAEDDTAEDEWAAALDAAERRSSWVVLSSTRPDGSWARFCCRQADRLLAIVDPARPLTGPPADARGVEIVFTRATGLARCLDTWRPRTHYLYRGTEEDAARLTRRVGGRALGLVLSGGGARGLAHIGVLQALEQRGLHIDRVGGTSMGSFIAGLVATGCDAGAAEDIARRELAGRNPFRDYTLPRHGLIRGVRGRAMLERVFGAALIEEAARPFFCVSCDLVSADEVVHRRDSIAEAISFSVSLPGVAPPRREGTRLHVDGGVLNNLPVDVMAEDGEGPIIAVDVMGRFTNLPGRLPSLVDTISRAIVLGSWRKAETGATLASLMIAPRLDRIPTFDFTRFDEIVRLGREAAEQALTDQHMEELL